MVFEATSAYVHVRNAPRYREAGIRAIDLTPTARGPYVIPPVNLSEHISEPNVNMVTCGGQATIPMVYTVSRCVPVAYAEIVATVASKSAGPGTRANIDEFTSTTASAVEAIGGAQRGKAIIILNPAEPPLIMRDTIFCSLPTDVDEEKIGASIVDMVSEVQQYVPGYRLRSEPQFDPPGVFGDLGRVAIFLEVEGAGDFLPSYSGNLDIMTAAATKVGEVDRGTCWKGPDDDGTSAGRPPLGGRAERGDDRPAARRPQRGRRRSCVRGPADQHRSIALARPSADRPQDRPDVTRGTGAVRRVRARLRHALRGHLLWRRRADPRSEGAATSRRGRGCDRARSRPPPSRHDDRRADVGGRLRRARDRSRRIAHQRMADHHRRHDRRQRELRCVRARQPTRTPARCRPAVLQDAAHRRRRRGV